MRHYKHCQPARPFFKNTMKYPPKLFLCIEKKMRKDYAREITLFRKKFMLKLITIGRNPNDPRSTVYYGVKEIKDYNTLIEITLERVPNV